MRKTLSHARKESLIQVRHAADVPPGPVLHSGDSSGGDLPFEGGEVESGAAVECGSGIPVSGIPVSGAPPLVGGA